MEDSERKQQNRARLEEDLEELLDACRHKLDVSVSTIETTGATVTPASRGTHLPHTTAHSADPANPTMPALFRSAAQLYEEFILVPDQCPRLVAYEVAFVLALWGLINVQYGDIEEGMGLAWGAWRAFEAPDLGLAQVHRRRLQRFAHDSNWERRDQAERRYARWLQEDERIREKNPHLTSKRSRAEQVRRRLDEQATTDHISRKLPKI